MAGMNKIFLRGNLGRRAEVKELGTTRLANFSIATSRSWKAKGSDDWTEETTWHNCTAFGRDADRIGAAEKGSPVFVEGRISKRKYTGKDGTEKEAVEVIAETLEVFGRLEKNEASDTNEKIESLLGTKPAARPIEEEEFPF